MRSPSRRTMSMILECVLRPTRPYTTWTPSRSSALAQPMLLSSSKRALSSSSTATCLPLAAASMSASTTGALRPTRYSVVLMASTSGSSAAVLTKSTTGSNES